MAFLVWLTSFSFWISVIILLALIYHWWKKPHPKFPPLIRGFPLIGVVPYLNDNYPEMIFKKWSLEMKKPVFAVRIGSEEIVVINSYEMAYEVRYFCVVVACLIFFPPVAEEQLQTLIKQLSFQLVLIGSYAPT